MSRLPGRGEAGAEEDGILAAHPARVRRRRPEAGPAPSGSAPAGPRPRALLVGPAVEAHGGALESALEIETAAPARVQARLADRPTDVLVLDGALGAQALRQTLAALPPAGSADRPAVILVGSARGRDRLERLLDGQVDDFVRAGGGARELLARVRGALRVRSYLAELSHKNAELQHLYARLEGMARRMAEELRLAGNVQRSLLPPPLQHARLDVAREFIPFRELGGDYYDLVELGPSRLALAIGDVMGKGVPAALLAANLKACLRAQLQMGEVPVEDLASRVNRLFWEVSPRGLFASLFLGVFDLDRRTLEYANAGHDYPFVVRPGGSVTELALGGSVLGLSEQARYERGEVALGAGDVLVFYSDGITDRENCSGEAYGVERLQQAASRSRNDPARIVLYTLLGEVQAWSSGPAEDDMTLVTAKVR